MGVLIGDESVFNFPSFFVAASDEVFDRLRNKIYEKRINLPVQCVQRKAEKIRTALLRENAAEKTKITGGNILLDACICRSTFFNRLLLLDLEMKKTGFE